MASFAGKENCSNFFDESNQRPLTIAFVGRTEVNLLLTLNSIFNAIGKAFKNTKINFLTSRNITSSCTDRVFYYKFAAGGHQCRIVDMIEFFNTHLARIDGKEKVDQFLQFLHPQMRHDHEEHNQMLNQMRKVIKNCESAIDAFLFVLNATHRIEEQLETIQVIFQYFGWNMLDYVIFVIIGKNESTQENFEQGRDRICNFLQSKGYSKEKIQERFIFLDNRNPSEEQANQLLDLVSCVTNATYGNPYTDAVFELAQRLSKKGKDKYMPKLPNEKVKKAEGQPRATSNLLDFICRKNSQRFVTVAAFGKTGKGKSATFNSFIKLANNQTDRLRVDYFESESGPDSVSDKVSVRKIWPADLPKFLLIDTVGLFDTSLTRGENEDDDIEKVAHVDEKHDFVLSQFAEVMRMFKGGVDVFLFVFKATDRATEEELETIDVIFKYFGSKLMDHIVFAITQKDNASYNVFESWKKHISNRLQEQGYPVRKIGERFIFVNNQNPHDLETYDFLSLIRDIKKSNLGLPYDNITFEQAQKNFDKEKKELEEKANKELRDKIDDDERKARARQQEQEKEMQLRIEKHNAENQKLQNELANARQQHQNQLAILRSGGNIDNAGCCVQ